MTARIPLLALMLLGALAPLPLTAGDDAICVPTAALGTTTVLETYYLRSWRDAESGYYQFYYERNGIEGLQITTLDSCGAPRDVKLIETCVPLLLEANLSCAPSEESVNNTTASATEPVTNTTNSTSTGDTLNTSLPASDPVQVSA